MHGEPYTGFAAGVVATTLPKEPHMFVGVNKLMVRSVVENTPWLLRAGFRAKRCVKRVRSMRYLPTGLPLWMPTMFVGR